MALQNSGAISLDDIHVEAGGTSGTTASINDSDIRSMIDKSDGATASFQEYYGASSSTYVAGTGGQTTTSGNYKYHYFNSSGQFQITEIGTGGPSNTIDFIVIAGGGGGGGQSGGGAGAGGYRTGTFTASTGNKTVTVGGGGQGAISGQSPFSLGEPANGSSSSITSGHTNTGGGKGSDALAGHDTAGSGGSGS